MAGPVAYFNNKSGLFRPIPVHPHVRPKWIENGEQEWSFPSFDRKSSTCAVKSCGSERRFTPCSGREFRRNPQRSFCPDACKGR